MYGKAVAIFGAAVAVTYLALSFPTVRIYPPNLLRIPANPITTPRRN